MQNTVLYSLYNRYKHAHELEEEESRAPGGFWFAIKSGEAILCDALASTKQDAKLFAVRKYMKKVMRKEANAQLEHVLFEITKLDMMCESLSK